MLLSRCLLSCGKHVVNGGSELVRTCAWDDDCIPPAMGFLGDAKESAPIILAEFHVEVFPLDLDLFRFDNVVHSGAECGRARAVGKAKNRRNLAPAKAGCPSPPQLLATAMLRPSWT
jgi:hypothetical protein